MFSALHGHWMEEHSPLAPTTKPFVFGNLNPLNRSRFSGATTLLSLVLHGRRMEERSPLALMTKPFVFGNLNPLNQSRFSRPFVFGNLNPLNQSRFSRVTQTPYGALHG